jgi:hypothetical protein
MRSKRIVTLVGMVAALMMVAGPAFAHFCYVASRSEQGNAKAANGKAWMSIDHYLGEVEGICADGLEHFSTEFLEPRGLSGSLVMHDKALLAGPHFGSAKMSDGKGVDHLFGSFEDFELIDELFAEMEAICAGA